MTVLIMAIAGIIVGFAIDAAIARMAREPFERGEVDEDDLRLRKSDGGLELGSEAGAFKMPDLLTSQSRLRTAAVVGATALIFGLLGRQYHHVWDLPIVAMDRHEASIVTSPPPCRKPIRCRVRRS